MNQQKCLKEGFAFVFLIHAYLPFKADPAVILVLLTARALTSI